MEIKPKIFLAHAREDARWVRRLYDLLQIIGANPWMASSDILPGSEWETIIRKEIKAASFVIACLSQNSISKRGYVQREFRLALDNCQEVPSAFPFLIPIRLDPCEVPDLQVGTLNLKELQWVDAFADGSFAALLKSLNLSETVASRSLLRLYGDSCSLSSIINLFGYFPDFRLVSRTTAPTRTRILTAGVRELRYFSSTPERENYLSTSEIATGVSQVRRLKN